MRIGWHCSSLLVDIVGFEDLIWLWREVHAYLLEEIEERLYEIVLEVELIVGHFRGQHEVRESWSNAAINELLALLEMNKLILLTVDDENGTSYELEHLSIIQPICQQICQELSNDALCALA